MTSLVGLLVKLKVVRQSKEAESAIHFQITTREGQIVASCSFGQGEIWLVGDELVRGLSLNIHIPTSELKYTYCTVSMTGGRRCDLRVQLIGHFSDGRFLPVLSSKSIRLKEGHRSSKMWNLENEYKPSLQKLIYVIVIMKTESVAKDSDTIGIIAVRDKAGNPMAFEYFGGGQIWAINSQHKIKVKLDKSVAESSICQLKFSFRAFSKEQKEKPWVTKIDLIGIFSAKSHRYLAPKGSLVGFGNGKVLHKQLEVMDLDMTAEVESLSSVDLGIRQTLTPSLKRLKELSFQTCIVGEFDENYKTLKENSYVVYQALSDLFLPEYNDVDPKEKMAIIDTAKSMLYRVRIAVRQQGRLQRVAPDFVLNLSHPNQVDAYLSPGSNEALCYLYAVPTGVIHGIVAKRVKKAPLEFHVFHIPSERNGGKFSEKLNIYFDSVRKRTPDFEVLYSLLETIGHQVIPFLHNVDRITFVPYANLSALPLHAIFIKHESNTTYIDDVVNSIQYGTCLPDLLHPTTLLEGKRGTHLGSVLSHARRKIKRKIPKHRVLAVIDRNLGLYWTQLEEDYYQILKSHGHHVDIAMDIEKVLALAGTARLITWSGHAFSSTDSWGGSYLLLGRNRIEAATIANSWDLAAAPIVVLACCETAIEHSEAGMDECCALDIAFRLAGAHSVVSTLWPIEDPLGALVTTIFPLFATAYQSPGRGLRNFQRAIRLGKWNDVLKLPNLPIAARELGALILEGMLKIKPSSLQHISWWGGFRYLGP